MSDIETSAQDRSLHEGLKRLKVGAFIALVIGYLVVIQGATRILTSDLDVEYGAPTTNEELWRMITVPVALGLLIAVVAVAALGWARPVMTDRRPVQRWLIVVPIVMVVAIVAGTNYGGLSDKGGSFILLLLLSALMVGFGEEMMFRGIGVTVFRTNGFTEGKVALWSTVIFGLAHATNIFSEGSKVALQVLATIAAGYFLYIIRRRTGTLVACALIHGLWDFGLLSSMVVEDEQYAGSVVFILAMLVLVVVLLVRRHHIEPEVQPATA